MYVAIVSAMTCEAKWQIILLGVMTVIYFVSANLFNPVVFQVAFKVPKHQPQQDVKGIR